MKKKMLVLSLVSSMMLATCLTGCGKTGKDSAGATDAVTATATDGTSEASTESNEPLVTSEDAKLNTEDNNATKTETNAMKYMKEDFLGDWISQIKAEKSFSIVETVYTQTNKDAESVADKQYVYEFDTEKNIEILNYDGVIQANDWDSDTHYVAVVDETATELANKKSEDEEKKAEDKETTEATTTEEASTEATTEADDKDTASDVGEPAETGTTQKVTVYKWVKNEDTAYQVGYEDCIKDIYEQSMKITKGAEYFNYSTDTYYFTASETTEDGIQVSVMIVTNTDFVPLHIIKEDVLPTGQIEQRVINFNYGDEVTMPELDSVVVETDFH